MSDEGRRRTSRKSSTEKLNSKKCCIGALYYSQSLMDRRLPPICAGVRKKSHSENGLDELQTETANLVDFKYLCVGYSLYDEDRIRSQPDRINLTDGEVNLPYCEGIEVISSRQLQQGPVLLKEGMDGDTPASENETQDSKKKQGIFGQRDHVPSFVSDPSRINWEQFPEKFVKSSNMIMLKMRHNARHLIDSVKRIWER